MKIRLNQNEAGSVLMVVLLSCTVVGIALGGYLNLVSAQNKSVVRSQMWNAAIPAVEAGVEEALTHMYYNSSNLTAHGWVQSSGLVLSNGITLTGTQFSRMRAIDSDSFYIVAISASVPPKIVSQGHVRVPLSSNFLSRTVRVTTTNDPLFTKAMVAEGNIDLSGNNVRTDSFDSANPAFSTNGRYDVAKARDNGDVATNSGVIDSFSAGNAKIYGKASTGPKGSIAMGPNGAVGSLAWHAAAKKGIEPGWSSDDMNTSFPPVTLPFTSGSTPAGGTVDGVTYRYILGTGNWRLSSGNFDGKVLVTGHANLIVDTKIQFSGNDIIEIRTNASLNLYANMASASISGQGVQNPGNATNFLYWGTPLNTSLTYSGNANFTGVFYAPNAAFTLGGGGSTTIDFSGSSITKTVKMNGNYNFHYDENLVLVGPKRGFVVSSWEEL